MRSGSVADAAPSESLCSLFLGMVMGPAEYAGVHTPGAGRTAQCSHVAAIVGQLQQCRVLLQYCTSAVQSPPPSMVTTVATSNSTSIHSIVHSIVHPTLKPHLQRPLYVSVSPVYDWAVRISCTLGLHGFPGAAWPPDTWVHEEPDEKYLCATRVQSRWQDSLPGAGALSQPLVTVDGADDSGALVVGTDCAALSRTRREPHCYFTKFILLTVVKHAS